MLLSLLDWGFLIISAVFSLLYTYFQSKRGKNSDYQILSFCNELYRCYAKKGMGKALAECAKLGSAPNEIKELSKRNVLGDIENNCKSSSDPNIRELCEIITFGLSSGADISNNLKTFISCLESDIENRNRVLQNSLNMDTLSRIGIIFFVPIFGGIASSIIGASGMILSSEVSTLKRSFQLIIIIYIALMSYIMNSFGMNGKSKNAALNALQTTIIGASIIRLSSSIITYAI